MDSLEIKEKLKQRYSDAYLVGHAIVGIGTGSKAIGAALGVTVGIGSLLAYKVSPLIVVVGIVGALLIWLVCYFVGVLISSQGQVLRATLDTAVNSSPVFDDSDKLEIVQRSFARTVVGGSSRAKSSSRPPDDPIATHCSKCGSPLTMKDKFFNSTGICKTCLGSTRR